jgi:hypothetical protein
MVSLGEVVAGPVKRSTCVPDLSCLHHAMLDSLIALYTGKKDKKRGANPDWRPSFCLFLIWIGAPLFVFFASF